MAHGDNRESGFYNTNVPSRRSDIGLHNHLPY